MVTPGGDILLPPYKHGNHMMRFLHISREHAPTLGIAEGEEHNERGDDNERNVVNAQSDENDMDDESNGGDRTNNGDVAGGGGSNNNASNADPLHSNLLEVRGPWYYGHGCGLQNFWTSRVVQWLRGALESAVAVQC